MRNPQIFMSGTESPTSTILRTRTPARRRHVTPISHFKQADKTDNLKCHRADSVRIVESPSDSHQETWSESKAAGSYPWPRNNYPLIPQ